MKVTKTSRQRDLVLRIVRSACCHPTAEWIFDEARKELPNISLGTVYRNLKKLRDDGKVQELGFGRGLNHFDGDMRDHYHVHCISCGTIQDVPHISSRAASHEIEELTRYQIHSHRLEFYGICPKCQQIRQVVV